jgi:hypothetical protein
LPPPNTATIVASHIEETAESRQKVAAGLAQLRTKREELPRRKHGNMPL